VKRDRRRLAGIGAAVSLVAAGMSMVGPPQAAAADWSACLDGPAARQAVFARAGEISGVPAKLLMAVSYMESRWDDHGAKPSAAGGFGPMHLTDPGLDRARAADKGEPGARLSDRAGTLGTAARLTGFSERALRTDDVANICGGAAVLSSYQPGTHSSHPRAWSRAVGRYSGAGDQDTALRFAKQVFTVLRHGAARTTSDGQQLRLGSTPQAGLNKAAITSDATLRDLEPNDDELDCPAGLGCESIPAPYEYYGPDTNDYGNHDLADRPNDLSIDYIVIHNTEGSYQTALQLVQDPTYLAWHYTIRSSDGHVAQHLNNKNVGWQAGNWYVNMHSIGIEHEGYAATGTWFTEAMYQNSAKLVRYLAEEYDVPLDRAHIIGHDQVPGVTPPYVAGMHWDTGPYWDWEHYMELLGAPIERDKHGRSDVVTVAPGFADNQQQVTGCDGPGSGPCPARGTNFTYLHTAPSKDAPLVNDPGLRPDGSPSTTYVSDIGARAQAGLKFLVAKKRRNWLGVWWLGDIAWLEKDATVKSTGRVVVPAGDEEVPVYGRAYPEAAAYDGTGVDPQAIIPLQYSIKPGQAYVLADDDVPADYYYAKSYQCSMVAHDCTLVEGDTEYYQISFGHRFAYVQADDVRVVPGVRR
jgi:hypothetical protein